MYRLLAELWWSFSSLLSPTPRDIRQEMGRDPVYHQPDTNQDDHDIPTGICRKRQFTRSLWTDMITLKTSCLSTVMGSSVERRATYQSNFCSCLSNNKESGWLDEYEKQVEGSLSY